MDSNPSTNDPREIWRSQPGEKSKVTMVLIRKIARESRAKTRRELFGMAWVHLMFAILAIVGIAKGTIFGTVPGAPEAQRAAYGVALLWCIAGAWVYQRGMWTAPLAGDAGLETGIAFLRREIQRRRDLAGRVLIWVIAPILFTLGVGVVPFMWYLAGTDPGMLRNTIPFFTLLTGWLIGTFVIRIRKKRELQREIEDLNEIEKENR
jgi:hypothetical protein